MKPTIFVLLLFGASQIFAQQEQADSLKPTVQLQEVVVVEQSTKSSELQFHNSNAQNGVEEIMERMSGISMIRRGNYAPDIVLHGMRNSQVGVTIDGMQVFGACTDRMDPSTSYVETNNLKSVCKTGEETNDGCHSANIAGGVDLKVKEPLFGGGFSGAVGSGYFSNGNGFNGLVNVSFASKKLAVNVNSVYRKVGNYTDGNGDLVKYSQYEKINFATNLRYRVQENQILRLDFILDDAYNIGYAALPMDVSFAKARIFGASYQWYFNGFVKDLTLKAYYNTIDHAMDDSQRPDVPIRMDMPGQSSTWGGFIETRTKDVGVHSFFGKAEIFSNFRHADMTMYPPNTTEPPMYMVTWPDVQKTSTNFFVKDAISWREANQVIVSARIQVDNNDITSEEGKNFLIPFGYTGPSTYVLPGIDFTYKRNLTTKQAVFVHAGYASRGPSTTEQYGFYLFNAYDGYDYIGKPDILAEDALKADVGYEWRSKKWMAEVNVFGYHINNYILGITDPDYDAMTIGANGVRVFDNIDYTDIYGIDFTINAELSSWLFMMGKFGYTRGVMPNSQNAPLIPPFNGLVSFKTVFSGFEVMLETEFATQQNLVNADYGDQVTAAYVVNNLRFLKPINFKSTVLSVEAGLDNMFDVAYRNHLDWGGILRPGRNVYVQLKYGF